MAEPPAPPPMTAVEIAVAEANAVALGVSIDQLMESAGRAVADEAERHVPKGGRIAVVAGTGNNGGDGAAAARFLLERGFPVELWGPSKPSEIPSPAARRAFDQLKGKLPLHTSTPAAADLAGMALVIDGLLGSGQTGPLRSPVREAVDAIRSAGRPVLSIDMPTGLFDPDGIVPRWTVALTALKEGMTPERCGATTVRPIGIPSEAIRATGPGDFLFYPPIAARTRRGRSSRIVIVGGGPYSGAPALAGLAALRTGAERATIFAPSPASELVQSFSPNLVVRRFGEEHFRPRDVRPIRNALYEAPPKAVLVGMGAGRDPETLQALRMLLEALAGTVPIVVDADGLDALPSQVTRRGGYDLIATPNAGELVRVFGGIPDGPLDDRLEAVRAIAAAHGITLLAKGQPDLISDGRHVASNSHHTLPMTVSGVGDVLAGTVGALLGDGVTPLGACRLGTYLVGDAGRRASESRGFSLMATDIIDAMPAALVAGLAGVRPPTDRTDQA